MTWTEASKIPHIEARIIDDAYGEILKAEKEAREAKKDKKKTKENVESMTFSFTNE